jgi:hypothetical protein
VRANPDAVASGVRRSWQASETSWANDWEATDALLGWHG